MSVRFYNQFNRAAVAASAPPVQPPRVKKVKPAAKKKAPRGQA